MLSKDNRTRAHSESFAWVFLAIGFLFGTLFNPVRTVGAQAGPAGQQQLSARGVRKCGPHDPATGRESRAESDGAVRAA